MIISETYTRETLADGIYSRYVDANGLHVHFLEAGCTQPDTPCILLLHGFPELAYSWRKNMLPFAERGYRVIAPDLRGFGQTTGWATGYDIDLTSFGNLNLVMDMISLLSVLNVSEVQMVASHDSGVQVASLAALIRPDIFKSAVFMGAPFMGISPRTMGKDIIPTPLESLPVFHELKALTRPRKHYQQYYASRETAAEMDCPPQGMHEFLKGYFYSKSADWSGNHPEPLKNWSAEEFAKMPTYYIMDRDKTMPETVMPYSEDLADRMLPWLTDSELDVYAKEYERTGFQGGLNWYRTGIGGENARQARLFAGRTIDVPVWFIAGTGDWCPYQIPGFLEKQENNCSDFRGCFFVPGAGHWVQQEQPEQVNKLLLSFLQ